MEPCYRHPARPAVEHCELCRRPVCGSCLWYAEAGRRLCPDHAADALRAGENVIPPERYAEGIGHAEAAAARPPARAVPYQGNSTDVTALLAAATGLMALLTCAGLSWAVPLVALALGLVALIQARDALEPARTRLLAWLGVAGGGFYLLVIAAVVGGMALCMLAGLAASASTVRVYPTTVPFLTPAP